MGANEDWSSWQRWVGHRPEGRVGRDFVRANCDRIRALFFWARVAVIPFSWCGALGCYWLGLRFYGPTSGTAALALWCFSPTVLAHAGLVTADVPAAAAAILFIGVLDRVWRQPTNRAGVVLGASLGLAALVKFSLIVLLPLILLLWAASFSGLVASGKKRELRKALLLSMPVALYLLNLGYLGAGSMTTIGSYQFVSQTMQGVQSLLPSGIPVPLPSDLIQGIDLQSRDFQFGWPSFLMGENRRGGFPSYFLWGILFKVPVGTLLLIGVGCTASKWFVGEVPLILVPSLLIFVASIPPSIHIGVRYVLPALPLLFVLASRSFERPGWHRRFGMICSLATGVAVLSATPNYLGFFSLPSKLFGDPQHLLADSNIDWGQDLYALAEWRDRYAGDDEMHVAYFGQMDLRCVGLEANLPPIAIDAVDEGNAASAIGSAVIIEPGLYAISVNFLTSFDPLDWGDTIGFTGCEKPKLGYFNELEAIAEIGSSIRVFRLDPKDCERLGSMYRFANLVEPRPSESQE
ncbi:glycosyltransferase family 39 protein [Rubripirellula amarantea]|nr:glycosyltransferase family 39 protein [Rubripirellula amarantea]